MAALAKPASYKPVDYSKFDNITDSDEESDHGMFGQPQMDFGEFPLGKGDEEDVPDCSCEHCAKAEAGRRAAAAVAAKQLASSSKSAAQSSSSKSGFNFGKAVENAKSTIAESKAKIVHNPEDSTCSSPGASDSNMSLVKAPKEGTATLNGHKKSPKKPGQVKFMNSYVPNGISDPVLRPTYQLCCGFVQTYLPARGYSDRVMCNVLDRLAFHNVSNTGEDPLSGLMQILLGLHIDLDPEDLVAYARKGGVAHKRQQEAERAEEEAQKHGKQTVEKVAEQLNNLSIPNPPMLQAMLAKHGLKGSTIGVTSLAGNDQHYMQTGPRNYDTDDDADDKIDSSNSDSSDDGIDEDELPPRKS